MWAAPSIIRECCSECANEKLSRAAPESPTRNSTHVRTLWSLRVQEMFGATREVAGILIGNGAMENYPQPKSETKLLECCGCGQNDEALLSMFVVKLIAFEVSPPYAKGGK
jgi:hypothetical protein